MGREVEGDVSRSRVDNPVIFVLAIVKKRIEDLVVLGRSSYGYYKDQKMVRLSTRRDKHLRYTVFSLSMGHGSMRKAR